MEFGLTQEQEMIRSQAAEFLKNECPTAFVRELMKSKHGHSEELWGKMSAMGWMGLILPEEYGGSGLSFIELVVVLEEMGRALLPGVYFSSVLLAGLALLEAGSDEQKNRWLVPLAEGKLKATLALTEPGGRWVAAGVRATAERSDRGYLINGTKLFVPDAQVADLLICAVRTSDSTRREDGITLFAVDRDTEGLNITPLETMDETRRLYEVSFEKVLIPGNRVIGITDCGWPVMECVDFSKSRVQFGRPIGSFQAIQHKCADMLLLTESARSAVYAAACAASEKKNDVGLLASIAKAYTSDAYTRVAGEGIQIHGGMGFTWEHDAHLYFKRAKADEVTFGDASYHRERVARLIGL